MMLMVSVEECHVIRSNHIRSIFDLCTTIHSSVPLFLFINTCMIADEYSCEYPIYLIISLSLGMDRHTWRGMMPFEMIRFINDDDGCRIDDLSAFITTEINLNDIIRT